MTISPFLFQSLRFKSLAQFVTFIALSITLYLNYLVRKLLPLWIVLIQNRSGSERSQLQDAAGHLETVNITGGIQIIGPLVRYLVRAACFKLFGSLRKTPVYTCECSAPQLPHYCC